jgi:hypothetical protein
MLHHKFVNTTKVLFFKHKREELEIDHGKKRTTPHPTHIPFSKSGCVPHM